MNSVNRFEALVEEKPQPCNERLRGLLGVSEVHIASGLEAAEALNAVIILDSRGAVVRPGETKRGQVAIHEMALEKALGSLSSQPVQQKEKRYALLGHLGFDANRPYQVTEFFDQSLYLFRYVA